MSKIIVTLYAVMDKRPEGVYSKNSVYSRVSE